MWQASRGRRGSFREDEDRLESPACIVLSGSKEVERIIIMGKLRLIVDGVEIQDVYRVEVILSDKDKPELNDHLTISVHLSPEDEKKISQKSILSMVKGVIYCSLDKVENGCLVCSKFKGSYT
jgi:hypothetical protein